MDIQAAAHGRLQKFRRQDEAVGGDDGSVQAEGFEVGSFLGIAAQALGRARRQAKVQRCLMHRAGHFALAAAGGFGRLRVNHGNLVPGIHKRAQGWDREFRRAHEGELHYLRPRRSFCSFISLASLRSRMLRLSEER